VEHFQQLFEIFPQSPYTGHALVRISEAKRQLAGKDIFVGDFYMKKRDYAGAIERYNRALKRYPNQVEQDKLLMLIGQATIRSDDEKRGRKILEFMVKTYPDSAYAAEAQMMIDNPSTALAKNSKLYEWFE
jgi:outer membrane protein assembly factor BamD